MYPWLGYSKMHRVANHILFHHPLLKMLSPYHLAHSSEVTKASTIPLFNLVTFVSLSFNCCCKFRYLVFQLSSPSSRIIPPLPSGPLSFATVALMVKSASMLPKRIFQWHS